MSVQPFRTFVTRRAGALAMALLIVLILAANGPDLRVRHFFFADDWGWLWRVEFVDVWQTFAFLPRYIYNDRPIGALFIKALYFTFGLNAKAYLWVQLCIHVANCVLIALIAKRYIGRAAALSVGALSGTWIVANTAVFWTAAAFDVLGAFFCLLAIWLWQLSITPRPGNRKTVVLQIAAAFAYFFAVRSKEFALALPALIFLFSLLLERRGLWQTIKDTWAVIAVALLMSGAYADLLLHGPKKLLGDSDNVYGLHASGIGPNLWWYFSRALYFHALGPWLTIATAALLGAAAFVDTQARRVVAVGLAGFVIMQGPTLMLTAHLEVLYLYASHFFMALAIGVVLSLGRFWKGAGVALSAALVILPAQSEWHRNELQYYDLKSAISRKQFEAFNQLVGDLVPAAVVVISGVEPYQNPFDYGPGYSLSVSRHNYSLTVGVATPEKPLISEFCKPAQQRYYIRFNGTQASDVTAEILRSCAATP